MFDEITLLDIMQNLYRNIYSFILLVLSHAKYLDHIISPTPTHLHLTSLPLYPPNFMLCPPNNNTKYNDKNEMKNRKSNNNQNNKTRNPKIMKKIMESISGCPITHREKQPSILKYF